MNIQELLKDSKIPKENIQYNVPMNNYTSFKIGGTAECLIKVESAEQIQEILKIVQKHQIPLTIIGNGSNLLVKDKGIRGIVLKIEIKKLEINKDKVVVGSGIKNGWLAQKLLKEELAGFEFASGIPGTIGGAIRMNAGAYGSEMKDIVKTVKYMDRSGNVYIIENSEAQFGYRNSMFCYNDYIILETELQLTKGNGQEIYNKMNEYAQSRKEKQPIEYPSAGSTFKRGADFITAKLIDECGLKGYQIGDAQISEKHAGFIINKGNATAVDVIKLIEYTKQQVYNKFEKKIETEIEIIGEDQFEK